MDEALPEGGLLVAATQAIPEEKEPTWRPPPLRAADPRDISEVQSFFFARRAAAAKAAAVCLCAVIVVWAAVVTYV